MATEAKIYGFTLWPEHDAKIAQLSAVLRCTRSMALRTIIDAATVRSVPTVEVELERRDFGLAGEVSSGDLSATAHE